MRITTAVAIMARQAAVLCKLIKMVSNDEPLCSGHRLAFDETGQVIAVKLESADSNEQSTWQILVVKITVYISWGCGRRVVQHIAS
jgi:hypothetical protein